MNANEVGNLVTCPICLNEVGFFKIDTLKRERDLLLKACKVGLARIESDIESDNMKVGEGNILRAAIAEAEKV